MARETMYSIPSADDVLDVRPDDTYYHSESDENDLSRLRRVVKAMLAVMTPAQRLEILNTIRERPSQEGDWPYYISEGEEGIR